MKLRSKELYIYVLIGLINTGAGVFFIFAFSALGFGDIVANFIGYMFGVVFSFFLNGKWTFGRKTLTCLEFFRFILVTIVAYLINLVVMLFVRDEMGFGSAMGQLAGVIAYATAGFLGMKFLAFSKAN